jgi:hypothetical protein
MENLVIQTRCDTLKRKERIVKWMEEIKKKSDNIPYYVILERAIKGEWARL